MRTDKINKHPDQIKQDLSLFRDLITCAHNLYFWSFDSNLEISYTNCPDDFLFEYMKTLEIINRFTNNEVNSSPIVMTNNLDFFYIADFEKNIEGKPLYIHVIGPIFIEDISIPKIEKSPALAHYSRNEKAEFLRIIQELPIISITRFYEYGLMLHYCITGEKITVSDLQYPRTDGLLNSKPEQEIVDAHGTWALEQKMLKMVEEGNLNMRQYASQMGGTVNLGKIGNGNPIRQLKNLTIVSITLCTRAAIKGGLPAEIAYTLSDNYITAVEASDNITDIAEINYMMQDDIINRVHQIKLSAGLSLQIKNCCAYIDLHIKESIPLSSLAKEVGYSENHLCRKFKEEMGQTISDYILEQKIEFSKNLLKETQISIQEIATELNFHSHSYFSEQFKRKTGLSPSAYRNKI